MYFREETLDDLLGLIIPVLIDSGAQVAPRKGENSEIIGALLELTNPRARISRTETKGTPFSCLGELLWYLAQSNELSFIRHYIPAYDASSDDGQTIHGAYGPRLFRMRDGVNQIENILALLSEHPSTRRAVIQLFDAADLSQHYSDIPCTCTLQFLIRDGRLNLISHMRSNDVFKGLPHDVFCFTMLQELVARSLKLELGTYKHLVGSLHLYTEDLKRAQDFLEEGVQDKVFMEEMPEGDQWKSIEKVLNWEAQIREGKVDDFSFNDVDEYWQLILRLLAIFKYTKVEAEDLKKARLIRDQYDLGIFKPYVRKKLETASKRN